MYESKATNQNFTWTLYGCETSAHPPSEERRLRMHTHTHPETLEAREKNPGGN